MRHLLAQDAIMLLQTGMSLCSIIYLDQSMDISVNSKTVIETVQKSNETLFHLVHLKAIEVFPFCFLTRLYGQAAKILVLEFLLVQKTIKRKVLL